MEPAHHRRGHYASPGLIQKIQGRETANEGGGTFMHVPGESRLGQEPDETLVLSDHHSKPVVRV